MTKKERYKYDPEYRERTIAKVKKYQSKMKRNPDFRALCHVRRVIYKTRNRIENALKYIAKQEKVLLQLIKERDTLAERVKNANKTKVSKLYL